jgi:uncharacterized SAM-dependent methyltransferase
MLLENPQRVARIFSLIARGERLVIGVDDVTELGILPAAFKIPDGIVRRFQEKICYVTEDSAFTVIPESRGWPTQPAR